MTIAASNPITTSDHIGYGDQESRTRETEMRGSGAAGPLCNADLQLPRPIEGGVNWVGMAARS
jgi:hypothetical protein